MYNSLSGGSRLDPYGGYVYESQQESHTGQASGDHPAILTRKCLCQDRYDAVGHSGGRPQTQREQHQEEKNGEQL